MRQANAITVITFNNDTDISAASSAGANLAGLRGTVTCTLLCSGLYYTGGAYGWGDPGEMFDGPINAGDANEAIWVNSVVGTSFDGSDVAENYQDNANSFASAALYIIMKIGRNPDYLMIKNLSGLLQTFTFAKADGAKGDLSHAFSLGTPPNSGNPPEVPIPAALPLFGTGLAIFGFVGWRRKRKVIPAV